jgi:hypothetical protein
VAGKNLGPPRRGSRSWEALRKAKAGAATPTLHGDRAAATRHLGSSQKPPVLSRKRLTWARRVFWGGAVAAIPVRTMWAGGGGLSGLRAWSPLLRAGVRAAEAARDGAECVEGVAMYP